MTREERDEVMKYSGMIRGICMMLLPDDSSYGEEDDTAHVRQLLLDISNDMEFLAKGGYVFMGETGPAIEAIEGSDENDV